MNRKGLPVDSSRASLPSEAFETWLSAVDGLLDKRMNALESRLDEKMEDLRVGSKRIEDEVKELRVGSKRIEDELKEVRRQVSDLDVRAERQERRLSAIESFPTPPIRQPNRLYATEVGSVSLPQRIRVGRAG